MCVCIYIASKGVNVSVHICVRVYGYIPDMNWKRKNEEEEEQA